MEKIARGTASQRTGGLDPDIPVVATVNDIAAGRDAEMEAALAAIRRARAERRTTDQEPASP